MRCSGRDTVMAQHGHGFATTPALSDKILWRSTDAVDRPDCSNIHFCLGFPRRTRCRSLIISRTNSKISGNGRPEAGFCIF